jgi:uroporphyrinogen decarboxylase
MTLRERVPAECSKLRRHVPERPETFAPGDKFVSNTTRNILPEVPPENVVAAFEAIRQFHGV